MALRRFNKIMKPVAIIGFIGFIVASLYGGYTFINKNILQKNTTEKLIMEKNYIHKQNNYLLDSAISILVFEVNS